MKKLRAIFAALIVGALLFASVQSAQAATATQSVGFPLYEFPGIGSLWPDVYAAGSQVPWIVINPASGPGVTVDPFYTAALGNKPSSQRAIGYVHSNYNTRPIAEVLSDIDDWYVMYPQISGIFMDLLNNGGAAADVCYGATVHNYVKSKHPNDLVVMNPGAHIEAAYEPYSDIFGNAEGTLTTYSTWTPYTDGFENNPAYANRFWHSIHTTDVADLNTALTLTRTNNAGWVLITDRTMPNPYTAVPTYWSTFLNSVDDLPPSQIPNRGLTALPAGCLDLSLATNKTMTIQNTQITTTLTNTVTNLDTTRFSPGATTLTYSLPAGATLTGLNGSGWNCSTSTMQCTNDTDIAANSALPVVTATVSVGCDYSSGSIGITLKNFANNSATSNSTLSKPDGCNPASPTEDSTTSQQFGSSTKTIPATYASAPTIAEETVTTATPSQPLPAAPAPTLSPSTPRTTNNDEITTRSSVAPITLGIVAFVLVGGLILWLVVRRRKA